MGFNYGYEKKKFDSRWKRLEVEYCDAGMSEEQIAAMKEYDWAWFCSQRVFQNHTQPIQYVQNGCVYFTDAGLQEYIAKCTHRAKPVEKSATYRKLRSVRA